MAQWASATREQEELFITHSAASFAKPPLLSGGQQVLAESGFDQVCGKDLCEVLREKEWTAEHGSLACISVAACRVLRGIDSETRDRVASPADFR